jgi:hypothetical protein
MAASSTHAPKGQATALPLAKAVTHLARVRKGHPVTQGFAQAIESGAATPEIRERWRRELSLVVADAARRFVGFHNVTSMRKALDIILGILSLALVERTKRTQDPEAWAAILVDVPMATLVTETLAIVKQANIQPVLLFSDVGDATQQPLRDALLSIATNRDSQNQWAGHAALSKKRLALKAMQDADDLARFSISYFLRQKPETWLNRYEKLTDFHDEPPGRPGRKSDRYLKKEACPAPEEVVNTLFFRYCLLKPKQTTKDFPANLALTLGQLSAYRDEYEANPKKWKAKALARFKQLLKLLSPAMKETVIVKDWFKRHLADGPPQKYQKESVEEAKVQPTPLVSRPKEEGPLPRPAIGPVNPEDIAPRETAIDQPEQDETDEEEPEEPPEDFIEIEGVTGIYVYDMYRK